MLCLIHFLLLLSIFGNVNTKHIRGNNNKVSEEALDERSLTFIVQTTNFAPYINTITNAANRIIGWNSFNNPSYYKLYQLIGYANRDVSFIMQFTESSNFISAFSQLPITNSSEPTCYDSLYIGLLTAITTLNISTNSESEIFTFSNTLPNDPYNLDSIYQYFGKGEYQGEPIHNFLIKTKENNCYFDTASVEYQMLLNFAKFNRGFISYLPQDTVSDTAFNIAIGIEERKILATTDFTEQCSADLAITNFFADNTTFSLVIFATGNSLVLKINGPDGGEYKPNHSLQYGNTQILQLNNIVNGNYAIQAVSFIQKSPCQIRVYGDTEKPFSIGTSVTYFY